MAEMKLEHLEPFEICTIRPPTENSSLTFRLTRNCYWNKCKFCPVYKTGAVFSRRSLDEVIRDIERAKALDDLMLTRGIGIPRYSRADYGRLPGLAGEILRAGKRTAPEAAAQKAAAELPADVDPRLAWFFSWFNDSPSLEESLAHLLTWRLAGGRTCFLGDADGLILKPEFLTAVLDEIKARFPTLERFTVYGRTRTAARQRSLADLQAMAAAGLNRVHFGLESGSDKVLDFVNKGESSAEHIEGCLKIKEAGLSCSIYIMPGLGGMKLSEEHALETARVINVIAPDFVRLRTLEIFPQTPLEKALKNGEFLECPEEQVVRELRSLISRIEAETELLSDSASNLLDLHGKLPDDRNRLLKIIDDYLDLSERDKRVFSFHSRLQSFLGQYGGLPEDLYEILNPYLRGESIDMGRCPDKVLENLIRTIRSRLMP
ncbi:MAG: coproporphyrinogen III oxidase [Syntrophus sp. PtaU1.Bin208]|nr:MAG: coproporphyrinogen III oxidase [Syntrophus sp. PtaU1.Bin208]